MYLCDYLTLPNAKPQGWQPYWAYCFFLAQISTRDVTCNTNYDHLQTILSHVGQEMPDVLFDRVWFLIYMTPFWIHFWNRKTKGNNGGNNNNKKKKKTTRTKNYQKNHNNQNKNVIIPNSKESQDAYDGTLWLPSTRAQSYVGSHPFLIDFPNQPGSPRRLRYACICIINTKEHERLIKKARAMLK